MIKVEVRGVAEVRRELDRLQVALRDQALSAALNKVGAKARTEMTRAITSEYMLRANEVRPRLNLSRASRGHLVVVMDPFASRRRGRALNLIHFVERRVTLAEGRRRAKAGNIAQVRFQVRRGGGKKMIPGLFIANQGRTVFKRVGKARLPIEAVSTIDVPSMFGARRISRRVLDRVQRELGVEVRRAVNLVLSRRGG